MFPEWTSPAPEELEVSIFGRTSGESVVVHIGDDRWVVVDSLKADGRSVPLTYLQCLGVDVSQRVELVVATHWHDDHIHGLTDLYREAAAASIVVPQAMLDDECRAFAAQFGGAPAGKITSGVQEWADLLQVIEARGWRGFQFGKAWSTLLRYPVGPLPHGQAISFEAMSPSDYDVVEFIKFLALQKESKASRAPDYGRNDISCAIHLSFGETSVLLCADLENVNSPQSGWKAVLSAKQCPTQKASLVKIPHHGSITGHHDGMWSQLCEDRPISTLSLWTRGLGKLPKRADVIRIDGLSSESYATSSRSTSGDRHRLQAVNSVLRRTKSKIRNLDLSLGHVRHRLRPGGTWQTELIGSACELRKVAA